MPPSFRADLAPLLGDFADAHRGVRRGVMFGRPALYVGRRLVACLMDDGVIVRLPEELARQEVRDGHASAFGRGTARTLGVWVMYRPRASRRARSFDAMLERAVDHVARRQAETPSTAPRRRKVTR